MNGMGFAVPGQPSTINMTASEETTHIGHTARCIYKVVSMQQAESPSGLNCRSLQTTSPGHTCTYIPPSSTQPVPPTSNSIEENNTFSAPYTSPPELPE